MSLPPLVQALSAANGAVVSTVLLYPLALTLTRSQTTGLNFLRSFRTLYNQQSQSFLSSFFPGLLPDVFSSAFSNFLYFYSFTFLRQFLIKRKLLLRGGGGGKSNGAVLSGFEEIAIGCLAGCIAKGITSPLSNITVRAQTSTDLKLKKNQQQETTIVEGTGTGSEIKNDLEKGFKVVAVEGDSSDDETSVYNPRSTNLSIAKEIYEEKGWQGFWSGYKSAIVLTLNPAITQYLIDIFRRSLVPVGSQPTVSQTFFTSAIASSCSSAITYPLILAKTRLQSKSSGRKLYKSNLDVFVKTFKKHGIFGLYAGIEGQVLKAFLSEGLKMLIKQRLELIIVLVHTILTRRKLRSAV